MVHWHLDFRFKKGKMKRKTVVALATFLFVTSASFGYIDPGTGSYLIQFLLAGIAGASLAIRIFWKRIKGFFSRQPIEPPKREE